jgi:hypothetical protein
MSDPRRRKPRRRSTRRDIFGSLALAATIFVSILALPFGRVHAEACATVSHIVGHEVPCGLASLDIVLDTDRKPFVFVSLKRIRLSTLL